MTCQNEVQTMISIWRYILQNNQVSASNFQLIYELVIWGSFISVVSSKNDGYAVNIICFMKLKQLYQQSEKYFYRKVLFSLFNQAQISHDWCPLLVHAISRLSAHYYENRNPNYDTRTFAVLLLFDDFICPGYPVPVSQQL